MIDQATQKVAISRVRVKPLKWSYSVPGLIRRVYHNSTAFGEIRIEHTMSDMWELKVPDGMVLPEGAQVMFGNSSIARTIAQSYYIQNVRRMVTYEGRFLPEHKEALTEGRLVWKMTASGDKATLIGSSSLNKTYSIYLTKDDDFRLLTMKHPVADIRGMVTVDYKLLSQAMDEAQYQHRQHVLSLFH